jgi:hypothetical protein
VVGRLLANRTASPFSGVAGMPRNQGLASFGITGCFASEGPAGIRRNTHAGTALKEFVVGLRRDLSAVQAALDLPWTTSPAEGQISRLKMLKRTMYGRAGFNLLRARVLHAT